MIRKNAILPIQADAKIMNEPLQNPSAEFVFPENYCKLPVQNCECKYLTIAMKRKQHSA
jgi:hypothetical protein